jgi:phosphatidylserine/phosphatidylglycerophosphate/cardiolipin synthase-like enzyme
MAEIVRPVAIANNEVAFLAWDLDERPLQGCLGFHIVREHLDDTGTVVEERPLASYVAFKGQHNTDQTAQNTTVWPVQKFTWRDLTLRRRRDGSGLRPANERVRYRIRAVGRHKPGLESVVTVVETSATTHQPNTYTGAPIPLGYLTPPAWTNAVDCTADHAPFTSTFTNGILSTQFLVRVLEEDGKKTPGELKKHLTTSGDWLRDYLSGDVLPLMRSFFDQPGGRFHAALYELDDDELEKLLKDHAPRIDLILSDAGETTTGTKPDEVTTFDTRNHRASAALRRIANEPGSTFTLQNRMFNGSGHIGHNKFVVHVDEHGVADSVLTGSTNWTWSGVAGQSNNCVRIDHPEVAAAFFAYWTRLAGDRWPDPHPLSGPAPDAGQHDELKEADTTPVPVDAGGGVTMELWFSPNVPKKTAPPPSTSTAPPPPDMARLFSLMRTARRAIFFLVFLPSRGGLHSIVSEAIDLGRKDPTLDVVGAISDSQAMWRAASLPTSTAKGDSAVPHTFVSDGVSVVLATALTDKSIGHDLGDFHIDETLAAEHAIIHDKILVLDPMDPERCVVAFGSHNLGYKASYSNDENLTIVRGHQSLAQAYAAHVLDVFDHYRFRAAEADAATAGVAGWAGFLAKTDQWQKSSSHRLADYFTGKVV